MIKYCIGVDLGGTAVKTGLFEITGKIVEKWQTPTDIREDGNYILSGIADTLKEHLHQLSIRPEEVKGIGMGIPGVVLENGIAAASVNLGWKNKNAAAELQGYMNLPVKAINDANAAALGEMWQGSGAGYSNLVMITLGTGIGGGVVIDGKLAAGHFGAGGELGHMPVVYDERNTCNCGRRGCLEQVASAAGIVKEAKSFLSKTDMDSSLRRHNDINAGTVCEEAKAGDPVALQVMERACRFLGQAMACVSSVIDPEVFVIGGGLSNVGFFLIDLIKKYYKEQVLFLSRDTDIRLAALGNDAGIYGAARRILYEY